MEDLTVVTAESFHPAKTFANRLAPLLAGVCLTLCFLVLTLMYLWAIRRYWGRTQARHGMCIGKEAIERRFPVQKMGPGTQYLEESTCAVCLEAIAEAQPCRRLQCGHSFHADCILEWWTHVPRTSLECPVCKRRQRVTAQDGTPAASASASSREAGRRTLGAGVAQAPSSRAVEQLEAVASV
mmetsp:Transcript_99342/g.289931  ORF Transcript_99342/g.289931 Transcript_99342/m.289931 type:complete len:183 (-) Transcript_99342:94-642(-)